MTVSVAMKTTEGLFLAADTMVTDEGVQLHDWTKIYRHKSGRIALGWSGDYQTARWTLDQILGSDPPQVWQKWAEEVAVTLAKNNHQLIARAKAVGRPEAGVASLIAAGFAEEQVTAVEFSPRGEIAMMPEDFLAIGVGRNNARIVFETLKRERPVVDVLFMRQVIGLTVKLTASCGFPVHIVKVSDSGIEEHDPILSCK